LVRLPGLEKKIKTSITSQSHSDLTWIFQQPAGHTPNRTGFNRFVHKSEQKHVFEYTSPYVGSPMGEWPLA